MRKEIKVIIGILSIFTLLLMESTRLKYTIEAVRISNELKAIKNENKKLEKNISREKIELTKKMDLDTMKSRAESELKMEVSKKINYVKVKKKYKE